jgi:hypothetical protein
VRGERDSEQEARRRDVRVRKERRSDTLYMREQEGSEKGEKK